MKIKIKIFNSIAAIVMAAVAMTALPSCNSDDDTDLIMTNPRLALVTYTGTRDVASQPGEMPTYVSTFDYYGTDGASSSCYTTVQTRIPSDLVKPGQRMVIGYSLVNGGSSLIPSGEIELKKYVLVNTVALTYGDHLQATAANAEMPLYYEGSTPSINRTGNYINLEAIMQYYPEREFSILADETTLDTSMPDLYISTTEKGIPQGVKSRTMASFDISTIWRNPSISGVKIHIKNTGGNLQQEFIFRK